MSALGWFMAGVLAALGIEACAFAAACWALIRGYRRAAKVLAAQKPAAPSTWSSPLTNYQRRLRAERARAN